MTLVRTPSALGSRLGLALALAALVFLCACRGGPPSRLVSVDETKALGHHGFSLVLEGAVSFSERELETAIDAELEDFRRGELRRAFVDDAAFALESHYRQAGFPLARVDYRIEARPAGPLVVLTIHEGPRVRLESLDFEGLAAFSPGFARRFFEFPAAGRGEPPWFTDRALRGGLSSLTDHYLTSGFLDVDILPPVVRIDEEQGLARVRVRIQEGVRFRLVEYHLEGPADDERAALDRRLRTGLGEPFTPRLALELRNRVLEWYGDRGYPDCEVEVVRELDPSTGEARLWLRVERGPRVRIDKVRVEGNQKTRAGFVRDRLRVGPGELHRRDRVRDSFRRLYRGGLFERVSLELEAPEEPRLAEDGSELRDLVVRVEEAPSQEFFVEPGYGSYEQFRLRLGFRERNLFGTGRAFRAEGTAAVKARRAVVGISDPEFFFDDLFADFFVRGSEREEPSFTRQEAGFGSSFSLPLARHVEGTLTYQYRRSRVVDVKVVDAEVLAAQQSLDISSILVSPRYDTRNDLFVPTSGEIVRFGVEVGNKTIGSELDFLRLTFNAAHFQPLHRSGNTVLGISAQGGVILPQGSSDVIPIQERFFNGGESSVRAFKESQLGPKDQNGQPIGGEGFTLASIELRQHLTGKLQGAAFFDAGNVVPSYTNWDRFEGFRYGVGAGLRYVLPVGPLRLDVGYNPEARAGEDDYVIHFSLGMAF